MLSHGLRTLGLEWPQFTPLVPLETDAASALVALAVAARAVRELAVGRTAIDGAAAARARERW